VSPKVPFQVMANRVKMQWLVRKACELDQERFAMQAVVHHLPGPVGSRPCEMRRHEIAVANSLSLNGRKVHREMVDRVRLHEAHEEVTLRLGQFRQRHALASFDPGFTAGGGENVAEGALADECSRAGLRDKVGVERSGQHTSPSSATRPRWRPLSTTFGFDEKDDGVTETTRSPRSVKLRLRW
jgi:hypothetical protein